jgi:hypothetical protein
VIANHIKEVPNQAPQRLSKQTHMPKEKKTAQSMEPDSDTGPTRMTTRARNATTHPGNVLRESSRARRSKEEVQEEKERKAAKKKEKQRRLAEAKALGAAGNAFVAQREMDMAAAANNFPRHRSGAQGTGESLLGKVNA